MIPCERCRKDVKVARVWVIDGEDLRICDSCDTKLMSQIRRFVTGEIVHLTAEPAEA